MSAFGGINAICFDEWERRLIFHAVCSWSTYSPSIFICLNAKKHTSGRWLPLRRDVTLLGESFLFGLTDHRATGCGAAVFGLAPRWSYNSSPRGLRSGRTKLKDTLTSALIFSFTWMNEFQVGAGTLTLKYSLMCPRHVAAAQTFVWPIQSCCLFQLLCD